MCRCNKAFDNNVKQCMLILCQNCYDISLDELEKQEASQRKTPEQGRGKNHVENFLGYLEGMEQLIATQGMMLIFVVWNWMKISVGSL